MPAARSLPVIGLPIDGGMDGMDALLSIVQMPKGIPVATVGVNNAQNAALLAIHVLAVSDTDLKQKLGAYREEQKQIVIETDVNPVFANFRNRRELMNVNTLIK